MEHFVLVICSDFFFDISFKNLKIFICNMQGWPNYDEEIIIQAIKEVLFALTRRKENSWKWE